MLLLFWSKIKIWVILRDSPILFSSQIYYKTIMNSKKKKLIPSDWKARNNKKFSNLHIDPRNTLKLAEMESLLHAEAQNSLAQEIDRSCLQVTPKNGKDGPSYSFSKPLIISMDTYSSRVIAHKVIFFSL